MGWFSNWISGWRDALAPDYGRQEIERRRMEREAARIWLRDEFAMAALTGLIAVQPAEHSLDGIAHFSYLAADAMMEQREKTYE
jgi:hypothetical protein